MKGFRLICFALTLINGSVFAAQTPAAQAPASRPQNATGKDGDPRTIATAPPGNPIRRIDVPSRRESRDYEDWQVEGTAGYWPFLPTGTVKTLSTPGDLRGDLGIRGYKSHPYFRLIIKPWRTHEIVMEGIPYRLTGATQLNRELEFMGRTFAVNDHIETKIKLNSLNLNYRYDFVSRNRGFMGLVLGLGYLEANAKIKSITRDVEEVNKARAVFPMVGTAFRTYPANSYRFSLDGEVKGMHLGNYGYYLQSNLGIGISLSQETTFRIGYAYLDADVHNKHESQGLRATFRGPSVSIQFRNR